MEELTEAQQPISEMVISASEHNQEEEALRPFEERYRNILESMEEIYYEVDLNGNFTFFNASSLKTLGYTDDELMGMNYRKYMDGENAEKVLEAFHKVYLTGETINGFDYEIITKNSKKIVVEASVSIKKDKNGNPLGFKGVIRDITTRKQAEKKLRESEERYRTILDNIEDGYYELDLNGNLTFFNYMIPTISGYSPEELMGKNYQEYADVESIRHMADTYYEVFRTGQPSKGLEWNIMRKDGSMIPLESSISLIRDRSGKPTGFRGIVRDISERKHTEEALRESQQMLRLVLDTIPVRVFWKDKELNYLGCNKQFAKDAGLKSTDEIIGRNDFDMVWVNQAELYRSDDRAVIESGKQKLNYEEPQTTPTGDKIWLHTSKTPLLDSNGIISGVLGTYEDITVQKLAQEALRESKQQMADIINFLPDATLVINKEGMVIAWNKAIEKMTGFSADEMIGKKNYEYAIPFYGERRPTLIDLVLMPKEEVEKKYCHIKRKGSLLIGDTDAPVVRGQKSFLSGWAQPIYDSSGEIVGAIECIRDITDKQRAEEALQESESRYRLLAENASDIIFTMDKDLQFTYISPSIERVRGFTVEEAMSQTPAEALTPASLEVGMNVFLEELEIEARETKDLRRTRTVELEETCKDGSTIWTESTFSPLRDNEERFTGFLGITRDITGRKLAEKSLQESEERYRTIFENATEGIFQTKHEGWFLSVNPALARMFGFSSPREMIDTVKNLNQELYVNPNDREHMLEILLQNHQIEGYEVEFYRKDRSKIWISLNIHVVRDAKGNPLYFEGTNVEITQRKQAEEERRKLEEQLMQAQKMESVGRLAGGVAHDFNNMLTPIMGYAEMLLDDLAPDDPHRNNVAQISHSAERSKGLVMQLLAFARRQTLEMKPVNLNRVITGVKNMIQRTLQENVKIEIRQAPVLGVIQADTGQVEQIILNLSVNAQDAMPDGGAIFIETSEVVLDDTYARTHEGITPGHYIMMSFIDTGTGMDKETLEHIFEPFYTTKGAGKGTGLGLATVYGIVKQHGGHISVYSEIGKGTIFRIYFPNYEGVDAPASAIRMKEKPLHGTETVLVVEDENQVRDITVNALRHYGYTVLEAQDGRTAQEAFNSYQGDIHMLLTDVILPDMNGRMVYTQLSSLRNELKVLYMSGYTSDVISHHGVLEPGVHFIQKPFNLQDLAYKVRDVLD